MSVQDATSSPTILAALNVLRIRGARVTAARRAVLDVLDSTTEHLNADEIVTRAAAAAPGLHRTTVYRALSTLGDFNIVLHTHIAGSATVFHLAGPEPRVHAHVQCTLCGCVVDVAAEEFVRLASTLYREIGFQLEPQHAALLGVCARCNAAEPKTE